MRLVDWDGREVNPIYDLNGYFLGTDNKGLKGKPIMMKREHFKQAFILGDIDCQMYPVSIEARITASIHHSNLKNRPDWDGIITDNEARMWYQNGNGQRLFIDKSKLDLAPVTTTDFSNENTICHNFFFDILSDKDIGRVYGSLTLTMLDLQTGEVGVGNLNDSYIDTYDFNSGGTLLRDVATHVASKIVGEGTSFKIYGWGENPKVKVK